MAINQATAQGENDRAQGIRRLEPLPSSKPGKTASRLIQDLLSYDPRRLGPSDRNILTDPAPQYHQDVILPSLVAKGSCRHKYMTKLDQSRLPAPDRKPDRSTSYRVASFCHECRCHLLLVVEFQNGNGEQPCPNTKYPLHHFIHHPRNSSRRGSSVDVRKGNRWVDQQRFECSSPYCPAVLKIRISPPRITAEWETMLTDEKLVKERAEAVMKLAPDRFEGIAPPLPINVLLNLRSYINNALRNPEVKKIASLNKKFVTCFGDWGQPCRDLLEYLGFMYDDKERSWTPPQPNVLPSHPLEEPLNILLDDVDKELMVLISQRPVSEHRIASVQFSPLPSLKDIERSLGALDYDKTPASRTVDLTAEEHPYYASLGATSDFADSLLIFAYERQMTLDPENGPYYLECLQDLAEGRKSEELVTKAVLMESEGHISRKDIPKAYQYFDLDPRYRELDEESIIGTFRSRVGDAPRQEAEMRRALRIIGLDRKSARIQSEAANSVTNYEQALAWLGADDTTSDEFIVSTYTVKITDNPSDRDTAHNAVSLIAEKRNSEALKSWLATGELGEIEMDVGHAYNRLGIEDRTLDDEMILTTYEIRLSEAPSQLQDLRMALKSIAKSKDSSLIASFLNTGMISSEHALSGWPVGLENIGNTCYLNSLLQFYFTVKPLRDLVLNFDEYRMPLDAESLRRKQVGSRRVTAKEVMRAQKFIVELQTLFRSMIAASTPSVIPEQELARLTLISSNNEDTIRRMSLLAGKRPSLGEINGMPVLGPTGPPPLGQGTKNEDSINGSSGLTMDIDPSTQQRALDQTTEVGGARDGDSSSEATLVESPTTEDTDVMIIDSVVEDQQQQILDDKENLPPKKVDIPRPSTPGSPPAALRESSPSKINQQERVVIRSTSASDGIDNGSTVNGAPPTPPTDGPPHRLPPVPPRPKAEEQQVNVQDEVELGAQQDVTEVVGNVLFQLQCAIKPMSIDKSGEQIDEIKHLFFGKTKSYIVKDDKVRTKEEFFSDIKIDVASGPRDIYSALDGYFDEQMVDVEGGQAPQYSTISHLPPILQVQIHRVQFDSERKVSFKSNHRLELKETIFLDRYMDDVDAELRQRRQEQWSWKARLRKLESRRAVLTDTEMQLNLPEVLERTKDYLLRLQCLKDDDSIQVDSATLSSMGEIAAEVRKELHDVEVEIKELTSNIQSQFIDLRRLPYRLQSVFIHRGSVSFGHYWIYIYDFTKDIWRKYNDGYVTEVKNREEIFEQEAYNPATPYFLVYVKDEAKDELVEPVCRHLPEDAEDLPMEMVPMDEDGGSTAAPASDGDRPPPWGGVHQGATHSITSWNARQSYNPDGW